MRLFIITFSLLFLFQTCLKGYVSTTKIKVLMYIAYRFVYLSNITIHS